MNESVDSFNYILGTQTIGIKYRFTKETGLVETAERIREMGSNLLKISMSWNYCREEYRLPQRDDIRSLTDLAKMEPSFRHVLDMPFAYYHIWASCFSSGRWRDGFSEKEKTNEYNEMYEFAAYLLKQYKGSGKTFLLGHWEGDWLLTPPASPDKNPSPQAIQGMIDWLNIRQKAIDDAKRDIGTDNVNIFHYTEVNLVQKALKGEKCAVNSVLPFTDVDYVSYSSYDTIGPAKGNASEPLKKALDYIESKMKPKPGITGKRVFIGEYGFPLTGTTTPELQDAYSRDVCRTAIDWGCPFVLYWELYCNENPDGHHKGFWLIDENNKKQPFYFTLENYYRQSKNFVQKFQSDNGRFPTDSEFRKYALKLLKNPKTE